jgi:hypothetical protein
VHRRVLDDPHPDLAGLISQPEARNGKAILAGDTGQLQAVENGGAMSLLADALGYVQIPAPIRFRAAWECRGDNPGTPKPGGPA